MTHISLVENVEPPRVVAVGDALRGLEEVKLQELLAVDRVEQRLAQPQGVELEVHLEQRVDDLQQRQLLLLVPWQQQGLSCESNPYLNRLCMHCIQRVDDLQQRELLLLVPWQQHVSPQCCPVELASSVSAYTVKSGTCKPCRDVHTASSYLCSHIACAP